MGVQEFFRAKQNILGGNLKLMARDYNEGAENKN